MTDLSIIRLESNRLYLFKKKIEGVREGRDEFLEKAIEILNPDRISVEKAIVD